MLSAVWGRLWSQNTAAADCRTGIWDYAGADEGGLGQWLGRQLMDGHWGWGGGLRLPDHSSCGEVHFAR